VFGEGADVTVADLRCGRWQDVLSDVECDALIVDAPYSDRTHSAYRDMEEVRRRDINYGCMSEEDVRDFVEWWSPRTRGWMVSITDSVLAPLWADAMASVGRYVFSPLSCVEAGKTVRISGDGPAQWSTLAVPARPATRAFSKWGALPGAYVLPPGEARAREAGVMGAKPLWLMRALVRDYSRPGDLVCDPCAGGATTLLAALMEGRRAVGAEMDPAHYEIGRKRLAKGFTPPLFAETSAAAPEQLKLGDE
jgi:site-specific DNA-methyltransferase (adenine-specific)